jgi:hypothetical protein
MSNSSIVLFVIAGVMTVLYIMRRRARLKGEDRD